MFSKIGESMRKYEKEKSKIERNETSVLFSSSKSCRDSLFKLININ